MTVLSVLVLVWLAASVPVGLGLAALVRRNGAAAREKPAVPAPSWPVGHTAP